MILRNLNKYVVFIPPFIYSIIIFLSMNTSFECDSNTYFNFSKSLLSGESINLLRGPVYPIFLILAGLNWADSIYLILFLQWLFGVLLSFIIINTLKVEKIQIRLFISIAVCLTGYTFYGARLFLAEQLTAFLAILSLFFIIRYYQRNNNRDLIYSSLLASLAFLTRYETLPILIAVIGFGFVQSLNKRDIKNTLTISLIPLIIILGWTSIKSNLTDGESEFGTLASETGSQLMTSLNFAIIEEQNRLLSEGFKDQAKDTSYFQSSNGPNTRKLIDLAKNHLINDNFLFERKFNGLSIDDSYKKEIENIWGPARDRPEIVIDWFFSTEIDKRSSQTVLLLNEIIVAEVGVEEADKLITSASFELIFNHPRVLLLYLKTALKWYGVDLENENKLYVGNRTISYWEVPFNPANCASGVLSVNQYEQYSKIFEQNREFRNIQTITSISMEVFRIFYSITVIVWIILNIFRRTKFRIEISFLILIHFLVVMFLTMSQAGINSKYGILPGSLSLLIVAHIANSIILSYKSIKKL